MKFIKIFLITILTLGLFLPLHGKAVTVIPPIIENVNLEPGKTYEGKFTVRNETDIPETFYFSAVNFSAKGEEGEAAFSTEEDSKIGLASWIEFDVPQMVVMDGETKEVEFVIHVPKDAEPGGHYAIMFTSSDPPHLTEGVGLAAKTGILMLAKAPGDIKELAELIEFSLASGKKVYNRPPVEFLIRIKNDGNIHFKPLGNITINGWAGEKTKVNSNPFNGNVLPNSIRALHPEWKGPEKAEGFWGELKNEWNHFGFGRYNAHLEMDWNSEGEKFIGNLKFWIIPWRILLVGLIILIILILFVRRYNKLIVKRAQKK